MELALPLLVASTAVSAVGEIAAGNAQAAQYEAAARAARFNAQLARQEASITGAQTAREEERQRRAGRGSIAEQYTAVAQSGVAPGAGSARLSLENAATEAELDALNVRYRGTMQARGLLSESMQQDFASKVAKKAAGRARTAGFIGAGAALLKGASSYATGGYKTPVRV